MPDAIDFALSARRFRAWPWWGKYFGGKIQIFENPKIQHRKNCFFQISTILGWKPRRRTIVSRAEKKNSQFSSNMFEIFLASPSRENGEIVGFSSFSPFSRRTSWWNQRAPIALIYDCLHQRGIGVCHKTTIGSTTTSIQWIMHFAGWFRLSFFSLSLDHNQQEKTQQTPAQLSLRDTTKSFILHPFYKGGGRKLYIYIFLYNTFLTLSLSLVEFILDDDRPLNWNELRLNESDSRTIN